ncbi:vacuolar fusion protein ccz1 [Coemansia sp. RSA 2336]|nr:vacuolar fusion protein ccz1 [Coemansia sp. RSA 2336]
MSSVYPAALSHFAVFCPALGPDEESTHEQLLFYAAAALPAFYPYSPNDYYSRNIHLRRRSSGGTSETAHVAGHKKTKAGGRSPSSHRASGTVVERGNKSGVKDTDSKGVQQERVVSLDTKLREIGLGAALIAFAKSFGKQQGEQRFHTVHSEKRRTLVYEPEPGVLVQLSLVLPRRVRPFEKEKGAYSIEFLDSELSDLALQRWLSQEYEAFRVRFGPVSRVLAAGRGQMAQEKLRVKRQLAGFFGKTMWFWDQRWDPRYGNELDLFHMLQPLPLLPIGSISLGGFAEFWRDLGSLQTDDSEGGSTPLVHAAAVLWRGSELVWSSWFGDELDADSRRVSEDSDERERILRALVAWSRAAYAPAFEVTENSTLTERIAAVSVSRPPSVLSNSRQHTAASPQSTFSFQAEHESAGGSSRNAEPSGGWSLPGPNWLWNWSGGPQSPNQQQQQQLPNQQQSVDQQAHATQTNSAAASEDSSRSSEGNSDSESVDIVRGGISQVLSRAVNALVEPRPPTPPEVDPVFTTDAYALSPADIENVHSSTGTMLVRDADVESLRSVGSLASVRSTRTTASTALSRHTGVGRSSLSTGAGGRNRSNTTQNGGVLNALSSIPGWQQSRHMRPAVRRGERAPSIGTSFSGATVESTRLRDDSRVSSAGSWWPSWMWGRGSNSGNADILEDAESLAPAAAESVLGDEGVLSPGNLAGVDLSSTFLYTGELPFPGLQPAEGDAGTRALQADRWQMEARSGSGSSSSGEEGQQPHGNVEGAGSQLDLALNEEMPAGYRHGNGVDVARGVVLAPRGIAGMQYDTRQLHKLFADSGMGASKEGAALEQPMFMKGGGTSDQVQDGYSRTLAYKFGDMLFVVFGPLHASDNAAAINEERSAQLHEAAEQRRAGGRKRRQRMAARHREAQGSDYARHKQYSGDEASRIEATVLRYAESLLAATERDAREAAQEQAREEQLAKRGRIPPYVSQSKGEKTVTRTSWEHNALVVNRSYAGYMGTRATNERLFARKRTLEREKEMHQELMVVGEEIARANVLLCVRMQDKGWVAGSSDGLSNALCVIDQPKATLVDAFNFLTRISHRASLPI